MITQEMVDKMNELLAEYAKEEEKRNNGGVVFFESVGWWKNQANIERVVLRNRAHNVMSEINAIIAMCGAKDESYTFKDGPGEQVISRIDLDTSEPLMFIQIRKLMDDAELAMIERKLPFGDHYEIIIRVK